METSNRSTFKLQHLLVQNPERVVENKETGTTRHIAGDMIFFDDLPHSEGVTKTNVISLSRKQLLYLCRVNQISVSNPDKAISILAGEIGSNRSHAVVSSTSKKKGEKYVDNGVEKEYTRDWYDNRIDSLVLPEKFRAALDARIIDEIIGSWEVVGSADGNTPAMTRLD
jgi:hypothetical protein